MRRNVLLLALALIVATAALASAAQASGPAPPGKDLVTLNCDGFGTVTVSVQRGQNSNGAGQIVDAKGHGIPVSFTFTITDLRSGLVLDSESQASGDGNAHPNQPPTHCSGVLFQAPASVFFGSVLPAGVAPTDMIQAAIDGWVIIKV